MDIRNKLRGLVEGLSPEQLAILADEVNRAAPPAEPPGVAIEDITLARMQDPAFAERVRNEVNAALRGER